MRRLALVAACVLGGVACARAATKVAPDPTPAPIASISAAPSTNASATTDAGSIGCAFDERWPKASLVDVDAWRSAHGVKKPIASKTCWDAGDRVGVPPSPGLLCRVVVPAAKSLASDVRAQLHRLDGDRLVVVWDETVATYANWLELTPTFSANGATLALHDSAPHRCEGAIDESIEKDGASVGMNGLTALLERACGRRGVYAWTGKGYVRATDSTKIAAGDLAGDPCPPDAKPSGTLVPLETP